MPSAATSGSRYIRLSLNVLAGVALLVVAACDNVPIEGTYPDNPGGSPVYDPQGTAKKPSTIFGEGGLTLFGGDKKEDNSGGGGIGVNSYLWRATLDTLGFMPLASADPFGGVVITDWYSTPTVPGERFKATVYILDRRLRADGIKVAVFKQAKGQSGEWQDAAVTPDTMVKLEDAILTRARQLRIDSAAK